MGKVFSAEEVSSGAIPQPGAHVAAGRYIIDTVQAAQDKGDIDTGLSYIYSLVVYGSTASKTANIRSDVDVIYTYFNRDPEVITPARKLFAEVEEKYHVPVEAQPYEVEALRDPLQHNIDPSFADHLNNASDAAYWRVGAPLSIYPPDSEPWSYDRRHLLKPALVYTAYKRRSFAKAISDYRGQLDFHRYQRALELPNAIGRKAFSLYSDEPLKPATEKDDNIKIASDSLELAARSTGWLRLQKAPRVFRSLAEKDREYSELLDGTIAGTVSSITYSRWIWKNYLPSLRLAHNVSDCWTKLFHSIIKETAPNHSVNRLPRENSHPIYDY